MVINYKKLKKQIRTDKFYGTYEHMFVATPEQRHQGMVNISYRGSKTSFIKAMRQMIRLDEDFRREFSL